MRGMRWWAGVDGDGDGEVLRVLGGVIFGIVLIWPETAARFSVRLENLQRGYVFPGRGFCHSLRDWDTRQFACAFGERVVSGYPSGNAHPIFCRCLSRPRSKQRYRKTRTGHLHVLLGARS